MATPILSQNEGPNAVKITAELDPKFWSLKITGTNDKFPPQPIEIKKYDVKFEALADGQPSEYSNRRPWIINFEVNQFGNHKTSQNRSISLLALYMFHQFASKSTIGLKIQCSFQRKALLITNYTASGPGTNETSPKIERVVVIFEVRTPINLTFHDILVELLPVIKEIGSLKGVILLVGRQSLRRREVGTLRIDEDLKKLIDESPDVHLPPVGVYMPSVTCMTMETFESTIGWYG
ncbi:uncharacterized protein EAF01_005849 [Botrytis porri]|uniref:uncharacterized protein n=1 Tax=Botrytis porri TaxID=87229 RepID=UPI0018FF8F5D|nr:uncharacterized protein EAF01_005849 [Botrytis porri]KAF7905328.1 hypothetical protein EAF01_005849 [Botrytis porri]